MRQLKIHNQITNRTANTERYFKEVNSYKTLSVEEEEEIAYKAYFENDEEAQQQLVKANLRFAVSVAKQFHSSTLSLDDLISEANEGLIVASKRFDPTRGVKFISFAVWWIRQRVLQALSDKGNMIRVPLNINSISAKIDRFRKEFYYKYDREPYEYEIREGVDKVPASFDFTKFKEVKSVRSFDDTIDSEGSDITLIDLIMGDDDINNEIDRDGLKKELANILIFPHPHAKYIITKLYGLNGETPRSLDEIGEEIGLTRERVRQINVKSLKILKQRILRIRKTNGKI